MLWEMFLHGSMEYHINLLIEHEHGEALLLRTADWMETLLTVSLVTDGMKAGSQQRMP